MNITPLQEPINVQIQTTSICTGKCIICPYLESWHKNNPGLMHDDIFNKILSNLSRYKIQKICPYLENEPLSDSKIFDRIIKIRKFFPSSIIEVSTNAFNLDEMHASMLINTLCNSPHEIWISFHGTNKINYENIMGLPFEKTLINIIQFLKQTQRHKINIVIRGAGQGRINDLNHKYCFSQKDYEAFWDNIFISNNIKNKPRINYFTYHDRAGTIKRNSINLKRLIRDDLSNFSCKRLNQWIHFLYTGEIILCCMDYHKETVFGNIQKESIEDVFNGEKYKEIYNKCTGNIDSNDNFICKRCISPGG